MNKQIPVKVKRKNIRQLYLRIDNEGRVIVTAPLLYPIGRINNWIQSKTSWINKQLIKIESQKVKFNQAPLTSNISKKEAKQTISNLVTELSQITQTQFNKVYISSAKTRWGTCSSKGNIRINWKLINAPREILEYVIYHELCHLKHPNHSKSFWTEVEKYVPNYKKHRKWLKENGSRLQVINDR